MHDNRDNEELLEALFWVSSFFRRCSFAHTSQLVSALKSCPNDCFCRYPDSVAFFRARWWTTGDRQTALCAGTLSREDFIVKVHRRNFVGRRDPRIVAQRKALQRTAPIVADPDSGWQRAKGLDPHFKDFVASVEEAFAVNCVALANQKHGRSSSKTIPQRQWHHANPASDSDSGSGSDRNVLRRVPGRLFLPARRLAVALQQVYSVHKHSGLEFKIGPVQRYCADRHIKPDDLLSLEDFAVVVNDVVSSALGKQPGGRAVGVPSIASVASQMYIRFCSNPSSVNLSADEVVRQVSVGRTPIQVEFLLQLAQAYQQNSVGVDPRLESGKSTRSPAKSKVAVSHAAPPRKKGNQSRYQRHSAVFAVPVSRIHRLLRAIGQTPAYVKEHVARFAMQLGAHSASDATSTFFSLAEFLATFGFLLDDALGSSANSLSAALAMTRANNSSEVATQCGQEVIKVLRNVLQSPGDPRYRRIRLHNARFQRCIGAVTGGLDLVSACGFSTTSDADGTLWLELQGDAAKDVSDGTCQWLAQSVARIERELISMGAAANVQALCDSIVRNAGSASSAHASIEMFLRFVFVLAVHCRFGSFLMPNISVCAWAWIQCHSQ